jgi:hypothetical protein
MIRASDQELTVRLSARPYGCPWEGGPVTEKQDVKGLLECLPSLTQSKEPLTVMKRDPSWLVAGRVAQPYTANLRKLSLELTEADATSANS